MWSFYPLLTASIASYVHNIMLDNMVSITLPWCVSAHRTIVRFSCSISCRSLLHTRPPVPGARACGRYLSQADRIRCSLEDASTATPSAMHLWLQQQLQMLLPLESYLSPHIHGGYALVITRFDSHSDVSSKGVCKTGLNDNKSTWGIEEACGRS